MRAGIAGSARRARRVRKRRHGLLLCSAVLAAVTGPALADDSGINRNNFGSPGLVDMPSARMAPDGELSAGASFFQNTQHYNFGFQVLPWLETSFRYTGLQHFDPAFPTYYDRSFAAKVRFWDEGDVLPAVALGINDLVGTGIYSGEYLVATKHIGSSLEATLGVGWGRLGSTDLFRNPVAQIIPSFKTRPGFTTPGGANLKVFFHGPDAGLFGGLIWHTPVENLSLVAEYSSDRYNVEAERGTFKPRNQMNFGATYQVSDGAMINLSYIYGTGISGNFSLQLDPVRSPYTNRIGPEPLPVAVRSGEEQRQGLAALSQHNRPAQFMVSSGAEKNSFVDALWRQPGIDDVAINGLALSVVVRDGDLAVRCRLFAALLSAYSGDIDRLTVRGTLSGKSVRCSGLIPRNDATAIAMPANLLVIPSATIIDAKGPAPVDIRAALRAIRDDARKQFLFVAAASIKGGEALIYYTNTHYYAESDALDRLTRILMADAPPQVEKFRFVAVINSTPQKEFDVLRGPEERAYMQEDMLDITRGGAAMASAPWSNPVLAADQRGRYPQFSWNIFPQVREELFDPSRPLAINIVAGIAGTAELLPGLTLNGEVESSLYNNINTARLSDSQLPHVRSDFVEYFDKGKSGIGNLDTDYRFRLAPDVFAIARAGYLESMFAGAGAEVLWRPQGDRWAIGVDAYEVWQRNFDRIFGLQDYHVFTGHVSLYYASPWYDLNFALRAGQYLAGDRGVTVEVTRRFATGVEIGAFFTKTNVSAEQFGEGSFDKGIIIRIPLGWTVPVNTQGTLALDVRPVQRDGGQRLDNDAMLYDETRRTSNAEFYLQNGAR